MQESCSPARKAPPRPRPPSRADAGDARDAGLAGSTPQAAAAPTDAAAQGRGVRGRFRQAARPATNEPLARFADAARTSASSVRLSARYLTGANKERDFELAKARTGAIRHALQANGTHRRKMQVELIEMPDGSLTADAGNRVDLTLR